MSENTLSSLKAQERDARRKLILDAARDLFAQKNFRNVTVREIAKTAGVSIGSIYYYYESLGELFLDVFLKSTESIIEWIDEELEHPEPSLKRLCCRYIDFLTDNLTFYQMMSNFMLGGEMSAEGTEKLNALMREFMDRLETAVAISSGAEENSRLMAHALFSSLNGIMLSYSRYPGRDKQEILRHTRRLAALIAEKFEAP
ncbi:MAG TPA: TetR/AcrR family transcriptional regulator [Desulfosalsimonadaceae bacterium]|nr:TetR/AcrR family transcriptional regulator [Desulfosalsimonadaceae bacterium]